MEILKGRRFAAFYFGLPIQDGFKKTNIRKRLRMLLKTQFYSDAEIESLRLQKFQKLVSHCYNNVPYYKRTFDAIGLLPKDIQSIDDIQKIPILTKEIIRREGEDLLAKNTDFRYVKSGKTGGTTGAPTRIYKDTEDRSLTWAAYYRWYQWMGVSLGDKEITFWGAKTITKGQSFTSWLKDNLLRLLFNKRAINSFDINNDRLPNIIDKLNKVKPVIIKGYLSSLLRIAEYINDNEIVLSFRPKAISTTTETLLPNHREILKRAFRAEVFDQYGCGEVGSIAFECEQHTGLHITSEHVIVEVLDSENKPIMETSGRLVVTNLDNFAMPILRFENGDVSTLVGGRCSCGIEHLRLKSIDGRTVDTIILKDGESVHGVFFTTLLFELNILSSDVSRFQVYQNFPGKVQIRFEAKFRLPADKERALTGHLMNYFTEVDIQYFTFLKPQENGKFKYIVSDV
jgi:phenylacetate-CoA ligase